MPKPRNEINPGREPWADVRRQLRQEVGFVCPVEDCQSPFLTWHHFDPPWRVEKHHRPEGMIALCGTHADQADNGAFTDQQLRYLKNAKAEDPPDVRERFNWMRQEIFAIVGGNFYYKEDPIFSINSRPCVWFNRDPHNNLLLNVDLPSASAEARIKIVDNWWAVSPSNIDDLVCPPKGRSIEVRSKTGDFFKIEFQSFDHWEGLKKNYPNIPDFVQERVVFPITTVELSEEIAKVGIRFDRHETVLGRTHLSGSYSEGNGAGGLALSVSEETMNALFDEIEL